MNDRYDARHSYSKFNALRALLLRYIIARFGRDNIGFVWAIVEPMFLCVGVMIVWSATKGSMDRGVSIISFIYTGYLPLTLWRHMTSLVGILRSNKHLTSFRGINFFIIVMSRMLLEFISVTTSAVFVYVCLFALKLIPPIDNIGHVINGWLLMAALSFGFGLIVLSLSEMTDVIERSIGPIQYFILPFCGCFYMLAWLPDRSREIASYLALVHSYELIRSGILGPEIVTYQDPIYGWAWATILIAVGLLMLDSVKNRVES